jgi:hypothetical protein
MQMSPTIAAAIVSVCRDVRQLGADDRNNHGGYNFVSVDKFYAAIGPVMAKYGLATLANVARSEVVESVGDNNKVKSHLHTEWELYLIHEDGSMYGPVRRDVTVIAAGPQAYASAESFVTKYFLRSTFKIPTGDKDDADLHENTPIPARQASPKASLKAGMSKTDERVLAFVAEINAVLDTSHFTIADFVEHCASDQTIEDRMAKIDAGVFDHLEAVRKLRQRITDLELGV